MKKFCKLREGDVKDADTENCQVRILIIVYGILYYLGTLKIQKFIMRCLRFIGNWKLVNHMSRSIRHSVVGI